MNYLIAVLLLCSTCYADQDMEIKKPLTINTSNAGKFEEFTRLFAEYGIPLEATHIDLAEIDADPVTVVAQKASSVPENVIVEDTSLEVEDAKVGINVRWLLDHLDEYQGKRATWTVLLAARHGNSVTVYKGEVFGRIVASSGKNGFGFDPVFLPYGANKTLAEAKPDSVNARAKAVEALVNNKVYKQVPPVTEWHGKWQ